MATEEKTEEPAALPPIRLQKPADIPRKLTREKLCATCGWPFTLEPGQKFFDCPNCYQKKMSELPKKHTATRVLSRVNCASCGELAFVSFIPDNPSTVLCRPCFKKQEKLERELKHR